MYVDEETILLEPHVEKLLKQRYYSPGEDWLQLVDRVIEHVYQLDSVEKEKARQLLLSRIFLPNSPCLVNAGKKNSGLFGCFVVGVREDSLESHVEVLGDIAMVGKAGGGAGFTGTFIRPENSPVAGSAHGFAYGPNNWAIQVNNYLDMITQGGFRKMALMYTMRSDHLNLEEFINLKQTNNENHGARFNQSVMATDKWLISATEINTKQHKLLKRLAENTWNNGEPGLLFYNTINNNTPYNACNCNSIETTNPCQPGFATLLTKNGLDDFSTIEVGDSIWSIDGWTNVVRKVSNGVKPVYKYKTTAGSFIGTKEHRVVSNKEKIEVQYADNIDILAGGLSSNKHNLQSVMDGLVLGDGSKHMRSSAKVYLTIGENDKDYFNDIISEYILEPHAVKYGSAWKVNTTITPEELPHTHERVVPDRFYYGNGNTIASFLRGLYSANGSVVNNRITFKTTSFKLLEQVQTMLSTIGIRSYYTTNKPCLVKHHNGIYKSKQSYDLNISTDRNIFFNKVGFIQTYKHMKLSEIVEKVTPNNKLKTHDFIDVEYLGDYEVFDITVDNDSHTYWTNGVNVSNCAEEPLPDWGSCNLGSINLSHNIFFDNNIFSFKKLIEIVKITTRFLDNVGIVNKFPNCKFEDWYKNHRPIGVGVMGVADLFLKLKIAYGSQESIDLLDDIFQVIYKTAKTTSEQLGEERGIPEHCKKLNRRNATLLTVAPTGSIAFIANCSHGIEPIFSPTYYRTDERGETYTFTHDMSDKPYFRSAVNDDVDKIPNWQEQIEIQAACQKWVDAGVSKTINLPNSATVEDVYNIFTTAWKKGLKGITVYRDGSRQTQVLTTEKKDILQKIIKNDAPKRPEKLLCKINNTVVKGEQWVVLVGFMGNDPYEVFAFRNGKLKYKEGKLIKHGGGKYNLVCDNNLIIEDIASTHMTDEEQALTRSISLALRHGAKIEYVVEQLSKSHGSVVSFSKAIMRTLKKYAKEMRTKDKCPECDINLVYESSCKNCKNCGYSACS